MINRIWCFMVIFGIVFTGISGKTEDISLVMLSGAKDAVDLFIVMAGKFMERNNENCGKKRRSGFYFPKNDADFKVAFSFRSARTQSHEIYFS